MFDSDKYDLIEKYFSVGLTSSEEQLFQRLVKTDPFFAQEVAKERQINEAIHQLGLSETGNTLNGIHKQQLRVKLRNRILSVGVTAVALGVIGYTFLAKDDATKEGKVAIQTEEVFVGKASQANESVVAQPELDVPQNVADKLTQNKPTQPQKLEAVRTTTKEDKDKEAEFPVDIKEEVVVINNDLNDTVAIEQSPITSQSTAAVVEDLCTSISLSNYTIKPSCTGSDNGQLNYTLDDISGGNAPYKTAIYHVGEEYEADENALVPGNYLLEITDKNDCKDTISGIVVTENWCLKRLEESFSPNYGEVWEYPIVAGVSSYNVVLRDAAQTVLLDKQVELEEDLEWDGRLTNGTTISGGVYFVEIKDQQTTYFVGTITIVQ